MCVRIVHTYFAGQTTKSEQRGVFLGKEKLTGHWIGLLGKEKLEISLQKPRRAP